MASQKGTMWVLALLLAVARCGAISVQTGGPGGAVFIDYLQGLHVPNFAMPTSEVTVELWSKLLPQLGGSISGGAWFSYAVTVNGTVLDYQLLLSPGYFCHATCATWAFGEPYDLDDGFWHHIAVAWRLGDVARLYFDGVLAFTLTLPATSEPLFPGGVLTIGQDAGTFNSFDGSGYAGSQPAHGMVDNFRFWSILRTREEIVGSMYTAINVGVSGLVLSLNFDTPGTTVLSVSDVERGGLPNKLVSFPDALGNTVYGGCLNCSVDSLPTLTVSDSYSISEEADIMVQVLGDRSRVLVALTYTARPSACQPDIFHNLSVAAHVSSLPVNGSLYRLDGVTAVGVGMALDVHNGSCSVTRGGGLGCDVHGSGLVTYESGSGFVSDAFEYVVTVTDVWSGETVASGVPGRVSVVLGHLPVVLDSVVPTMKIGQQTPLELGVVDPDGDVPISVVITELPMHGRLWQGDGVAVFQRETLIVDPLGRTTYEPGTYMTGPGIDSLEFRVGKRYRPLARVWHMRTDRQGVVADSVIDLFDSRHAGVALDCGGYHNPAGVVCQSVSPLGVSHRISITTEPNELNPIAKGLAASTTLVSAMDFAIRSVNSSFRGWMEVVTPNAAFAAYQRMFVLSAWMQQSPDTVEGISTTIVSSYGWCDDSLGAICEKLRFWIRPGYDVTHTGISLRCASNLTSGPTMVSVNHTFLPLAVSLGRWFPVFVKWVADLSFVCFEVPGRPQLCSSLPCSVVSDTSNAAEMITGFHRIVIGSHLSGDSIVEIDGGSSNESVQYTGNTLGLADDIRLYQCDASDAVNARAAMLSLMRTPIQDDFEPLISPSLTLLGSFNFDHPEAMMYQPVSLSSVFPEWFVYEATPEVSTFAVHAVFDPSSFYDVVDIAGSCVVDSSQLLLVTLESALSFRFLSSDLNHNFTYDRSVVLVAEKRPLGLLPLMVPSTCPTFNTFECKEDGTVAFQLQGFDPNKQDIVAKITRFPVHGVLYNVLANGTMGDPVLTLSTLASETVIHQWVKEVVGFSSEWQDTEAYLASVNATMDDVRGGAVSQDVFAECYCTLGIMGPPDCPRTNADCPYSWNPLLLNDGYQHVDLKFETPVYISQVEVIIPFGGQQTVSIQAWNPNTKKWSSIYQAGNCEVSVTVVSSAVLEFVDLLTNPCRTAFKTDVIRVIFNTDLTKQWLMVDAVKLSGTLGLPPGAVTNLNRYVAYKPNRDVFGFDGFSYVVTDCPYKDDRLSENEEVQIVIGGVSDPPSVMEWEFDVKDDGNTSFSIPMRSIDEVSYVGAGNNTWPANYALVVHSVPKLGQLVVFGNVVTEATLPFVAFGNSVTVTYVPTTNLTLRPLLCDGVDGFNVTARNLAVDSAVRESSMRTIRLNVGCAAIVCAAGQQAATSSLSKSVCISCGPGSYNLDVNSDCKPCPSGAICVGGSSLAAQAGFWFHKDSFFKCPAGRCCTDGGCDVKAGNVCASGRAGVLCGECADPQFVAWGSVCMYCTRIGWVPLILMGVGVLVLVSVLLMNDYNDIQSRFKQYIDYNQLFDLVTRSSSSQPTYFVQRIGMIGVLSFNMPSFAKNFNLPCLAPIKGLTKFLVQSYVLPVGLLGGLGLCFSVLYIRRRYYYGQDFDSTQFYQALWQIILLCYTSLNIAGMSLVTCKDVSEWSLLEADTSVECRGSSYYLFSSLGMLVSATISFALPVYIIWCHARHRLVYWHAGRLMTVSDTMNVSSVVPSKPDPDLVDTKRVRRISVELDGLGVKASSSSVSHTSVSEKDTSEVGEHPHFTASRRRKELSSETLVHALEPKVRSPNARQPGVPAALPTKRLIRGILTHKTSSATGGVEPIGAAESHQNGFCDELSPVKPGVKRVVSFGRREVLEFDLAPEDLDAEPRYVGSRRDLMLTKKASRTQNTDIVNQISFHVPEVVIPGSPRRKSLVVLSPSPRASGQSSSITAEVTYVDGVPMIGLPVAPTAVSHGLIPPVDLENDPGMFAWMYERLVRLNESRAAVESQSKSKFSLGEALVHRTRMYKDHVRWWYEAYFLTRRTMFTLLSVIFRNDDMRRSVSGLVWMLMTLVWRRSYSVVMCGMFVLVMCEHEQQLVFLAALLALFFQCRVQPYRIPTANMREVILLCFLCLATGYELLRVTPVYTAVPNTGIPDVVISIITFLGVAWISYYVLFAIRRKTAKFVGFLRSKRASVVPVAPEAK